MPTNTHCVELYTRDQCGVWIVGYLDTWISRAFLPTKYPDTEKRYQGLLTWGFNDASKHPLCSQSFTRDPCGVWIVGYPDTWISRAFLPAKYPDAEKSYQGLMTWGFNDASEHPLCKALLEIKVVSEQQDFRILGYLRLLGLPSIRILKKLSRINDVGI